MYAPFKLNVNADNFKRGCCPTCGKPADEYNQIKIVGRTVVRGGDCVQLGYREARLLDVLLRSWPNVVHKDVLIGAVWTPDDEPEHAENTIKVYLCRLRKKLEPLRLGISVGHWANPNYRAEILPIELLKAS